MYKLLKNLAQVKNPRLYSQLVKQCIVRVSSTVVLKEENLKDIIFFYSNLVNIERFLYARFDTVQDLMKAMLNRKAELSQIDILKIMEGTV